MQFIYKPKNSGFTLIETIIALGLIMMSMMMVMAVVAPGMKRAKTISRVEQMHADAVYITNNLGYWIRQAKILSVSPDNKTLTIVINDTTTKIVTIGGDDFTLDGGSLNGSGMKVSGLSFTKLAKSVKMSFTLEADGGTETLPVSTTLAQRNRF